MTQQATLNPPTTNDQWLRRFQRLRDLTLGLTSEDSRYPSILAMLGQCDEYYRHHNDDAFIATGKRIATVMSLPQNTEHFAHSD